MRLPPRTGGRRTPLLWPLAVCVALLVPACSGGSGESDDGAGASPFPGPGAPADTVPWGYIETGDLPEIRDRGYLRVVDVVKPEAQYLPRDGSLEALGRRLVELFAADLGLEIHYVLIPPGEDAHRYVLEGKGDVALGKLLGTTAMSSEEMIYSLPFRMVAAQIVTRADDTIEKAADLVGRRIAFQEGTPLYGPFEERLSQVPGIETVMVPADLHPEEILHRVATGEYDTALAESSWTDMALQYRDDIKVAIEADVDLTYAAAMRPGSGSLRREFDEFLLDELPTRGEERGYVTDLDGIKERNALRVLTVNGPASYFIYQGELRGFDYELAKKFADELGVHVQMVVVPSADELVPWLLEGLGDVIAAGSVMVGDDQEASVVKSRPYLYVTPTLVAPLDAPVFDSPGEMAGQTVVLRPHSPYWSIIYSIQALGIDISPQAAPTHYQAEHLIDAVARGEIEYAVEGSHLLDIELAWRDDVKAAGSLSTEVGLPWIVASDNQALMEEINAFIRREYRGTFYNILRKRYFDPDPKAVREAVAEAREGRLSPYDDLFRKYADQYSVDWRLVAAQSYQESRWNPNARSSTGATGLMQVLPRTGREFGFHDLLDPDVGVQAGVRYFQWCWERFEVSLPIADRAAFALAAYNAGWGHVSDARRLAAEYDMDPNRWVGNVEQAMLMKSRRDIAAKTRFGYVRGSEPVNYVRQIMERFRLFVRLTE